MPTLFITTLMQSAGHNMVALTVVFEPSNTDFFKTRKLSEKNCFVVVVVVVVVVVSFLSI